MFSRLVLSVGCLHVIPWFISWVYRRYIWRKCFFSSFGNLNNLSCANTCKSQRFFFTDNSLHFTLFLFDTRICRYVFFSRFTRIAKKKYFKFGKLPWRIFSFQSSWYRCFIGVLILSFESFRQGSSFSFLIANRIYEAKPQSCKLVVIYRLR